MSRAIHWLHYQPRCGTVVRQSIQEVVQYVILSHRWDEIVGELTSHDISGGKRYVAGFRKFDQSGKTSSKLGHKLAWVNTYCMDKTKAVELSEAIHAMYKSCTLQSSNVHVQVTRGLHVGESCRSSLALALSNSSFTTNLATLYASCDRWR